MKRILAKLMVGCLLLGAFFCANTAAAEEPRDAGLSFDEDGTFTVLLYADAQDTQLTSTYLTRALRNVLSVSDVDLVILLGDQLEGSSPLLHIGSGYENVRRAIDNVLSPVVDAGIPFAYLFGNHDYDAPLSAKFQMELYDAYPLCLTKSDEAGVADKSVFMLPVKTYDGLSTALCLYLFDSGNLLPDGNYAAVTADQVAWYNGQSAAMRAENGDRPVPSAAFLHIPVQEVYELFTEVPKGTAGAFKGVGFQRETWFLPDSDKIFLGDVNESPCPSSENNGLFDAFVGNDDVFLVAAGHDHVNSYIGSLRGVDLLAAPGSSYTSYGSREMRGVRLIRFREDNPKSYDTIHVPFSDYDGVKGLNWPYYYLVTTTRIPNAAKVAVVALILVAAIVWLSVSLFRQSKKPPLPEGKDDDFDDDEG